MTHPMDDDALGVAIFDLGCAIAALEEALATTIDPEARALTYRALDWTYSEPKGFRQQLADLAASLGADLTTPLQEHIALEADGHALVLTRSKATESWDWDRLVARVSARVADEAVDRESGEIIPPGVLAERVGAAVADVAGLTPSKKGRKTSIAKHGLDPADFIEKSGGYLSVRWEQ